MNGRTWLGMPRWFWLLAAALESVALVAAIVLDMLNIS